jgi:hypothetical protein
MESFEDRLRRFLNSTEEEIPLNLMLWGQNFLLPQLRIAKQHLLDNLIFLGTHAFIQTFSEKVFGKTGLSATTFFLQNFLDGPNQDQQFSLIADELHEMRNVMAHKLFSSKTHTMVLDYGMSEGWKKALGVLRVNPMVYAEQFEAALDGGRLWDWEQFTTKETSIKQKYLFIKDWLALPKSDQISLLIKQLESASTMPDIQTAEAQIKQMISTRYNL